MPTYIDFRAHETCVLVNSEGDKAIFRCKVAKPGATGVFWTNHNLSIFKILPESVVKLVTQ